MKKTKKTNIWKLLSIFLIGVVVGVGLVKVDGYVRTAETNVLEVEKNQKKDVVVKKVVSKSVFPTKVTPEGYFYMGEDNAPVTIHEFAAYSCGFCGRFYKNTLPKIIDKYVKTGKVKFVFRDYPLGSRDLAVVARCAGEQSKFWEMHNLLFDKSSEWKAAEDQSSFFRNVAKEFDLDLEKYNSCVESGKFDEAIDADRDEGIEAGVTGVPGFLINDEILRGAQPFSAFEEMVEVELGK